MSWNFNFLNFFLKGLSIMLFFFIGLNIFYFSTNIIKSKASICDVEKQSKFILECLNAKELQAFGACERIAKSLYCK